MEASESLFRSVRTASPFPGVEIFTPFPIETYERRLAAVHAAMDRDGLDVIVLTVPESIHYLTNYHTVGGSYAALVVSKKGGPDPKLVARELETSNAKYRTNVEYEWWGEGVSAEGIVARLISELPRATSVRRTSPLAIGYEETSQRLTVLSHTDLTRRIGELVNDDFTWVESSLLLLQIRCQKDDLELSYVKKAAEASFAGLKALVSAVKPGATETQLAGACLHAMQDHGGEYAAYPPFVSSGTSGCLGHHGASRKQLLEGETVFVEVGGCYNRYHAARMHTMYVGTEPPEWYLEAERHLKAATAAGTRAAVAGARCVDVDAAMRAEVAKITIPHWMSTRTGYAIGTGLATDWCEFHCLIYEESTSSLKEGQTLHLIPWIQIPDVGAMGFSDTVQVTTSGGVSCFPGPSPRYYERAVRVYSNPSPAHDVATDVAGMQAAIGFHQRRGTAMTPLVSCRPLGEDGPAVFLKDESARCGVRAFKSLGVTYAVERLFASGELKTGDTVASMTDGNHGEALSVVAKQRGLKCIIFVPHNMSRERIEVLTLMGADVRELEGRGSYDDCIAQLRVDAAANGWTIVADSSWEGYTAVPMDIMSGYTTLFHEACTQMKRPPTHVLVQAGVGGLLAAGAAYMSSRHPACKVVSVEPIDAGCILENARAHATADEVFECEGAADSNMQGLNCGTPSPVTWPIIAAHVGDFVAIGDEWARKAVRALYHRHRLSISESGAAGYAGLLAAVSGEVDGDLGITAASRVLVILSEGVTNTESFNQILGSDVVTETPAEVAATIAKRCGVALAAADDDKAPPTKVLEGEVIFGSATDSSSSSSTRPSHEEEAGVFALDLSDAPAPSKGLMALGEPTTPTKESVEALLSEGGIRLGLGSKATSYNSLDSLDLDGPTTSGLFHSGMSLSPPPRTYSMDLSHYGNLASSPYLGGDTKDGITREVSVEDAADEIEELARSYDSAEEVTVHAGSMWAQAVKAEHTKAADVTLNVKLNVTPCTSSEELVEKTSMSSSPKTTRGFAVGEEAVKKTPTRGFTVGPPQKEPSPIWSHMVQGTKAAMARAGHRTTAGSGEYPAPPSAMAGGARQSPPIWSQMANMQERLVAAAPATARARARSFEEPSSEA